MSPASPSFSDSRFIVGIDLGTTNCAVSYVDLQSDDHTITPFPLLQLIAPGETAFRPLLPSFLYIPSKGEFSEGALSLPWQADSTVAVGHFARHHGAAVPDQLVSSAKSWLAHGGVDRQAPILPWGDSQAPRKLSPVAASRHYLEHIRQAWDHQFAAQRDADGNPCILSQQQVILTVPASFDETARELTLQASREAGLERITLIEEPLAAFYAWLSGQGEAWKTRLSPGEQILVVDVGGGTTDFSLIRLDENLTLRRHAVGDHLLLGGDNMDMAIARQLEAQWHVRLPQRQWSMLCQECRRAKETLLKPDAPDAVTVHLAAPGSSLLAGARNGVLKRQDIHKLLLDGFFPLIPEDSPPPARRGGIQEMGLPYAADPAISRHLLEFLRHGGPSEGQPATPSCVLFNGGALIPPLLRQRLKEQLEQWQHGHEVRELEARDFDLAVSLGAVTYGLARRGEAVRVKGGIARVYFLNVDHDGASQFVCLMPRDTEEGVVRRLEGHVFHLLANTPVRFPLYTSATRLGDKLGQVISDPEGLTALPPLVTTLKFGRSGNAQQLSAVLSAKLNEIGTLELWCDVPETGHRFPLAFDLHATSSIAKTYDNNETTSVIVEEARCEAALAHLQQAFAGNANGLDTVLKDLERLLDIPRNQWPASLLRRLADALIRQMAWRETSVGHEARWLNLLGFSMRPGYGCAGDDWRVSELWKLWHAGPLHPKSPQVCAEWWIFWRRLAAGLRSGQQEQVAGAIQRQIISKDNRNAVGKHDAAGQEMWRTVAALEALPPKAKLRYLNVLLKDTRSLDERMFWVVAKLAARQLLTGPQNAVIPPEQWQTLYPLLLKKVEQAAYPSSGLFAIANSLRLTCLRNIDCSETLRQQAAALLAEHQAPEAWRHLPIALQEDTHDLQTELLGDSLPLGIMLQTP